MHRRGGAGRSQHQHRAAERSFLLVASPLRRRPLLPCVVSVPWLLLLLLLPPPHERHRTSHHAVLPIHPRCASAQAAQKCRKIYPHLTALVLLVIKFVTSRATAAASTAAMSPPDNPSSHRLSATEVTHRLEATGIRKESQRVALAW